MNENTATTTETTEAPKAVAAAKPAKKPAKKVEKKNKPAKKVEKNVDAPKKELNKPQTYILKVLAKVKGALTRPEIAEKAGKLGCSTSNGRISDEAGNYGYLVNKKWIRVEQIGKVGAADDRPQTVYAITASGKAALAKFAVELKK